MVIKNSCLDCRFGFKKSKKQEKRCEWFKKNAPKLNLPVPLKDAYGWIQRPQPYVNCPAYKK